MAVVVALLLVVGSGRAGAQGLADLYEAALRSNPNLKVREFDIERARAESDGARSRLLPQLFASGEWTANRQTDASAAAQRYAGKRSSLSARQSLYDAPARRRFEATQATVLQRTHELALTRATLFDELLDRYLQVLYAQDTIAALAAETQATARQVDRLRAMRERQMAKVTDVAEAEAYAMALVTRGIDARNERSTALARLAELCGMAVAQVPPLVPMVHAPVPGSLEEWTGTALRQHPRLMALLQAVEAAERQVHASRAEHHPQVAVALSHVYSNTGYDNRRQPPYHATSLGLELRVPLYEGGRVDAAVREAAARLGAAQQQLEAARREIEREVSTLWSSAQANLARIGSTAAEVQSLELSVQSQERALELGVSRITDLLIARQRLLKARADQAKARYDHLRDVVALTTQAGALTSAEINQWDRWFDSGTR
ncbi:MAG: TolC family outer membrane protein [Pseudomonadota bacterium]